MPEITIPLVADLDIHDFDGPSITELHSGGVNCVATHITSTPTISQRPSIDIFEDHDNISGLEAKGRGLYFWEHVNKLYLVNDDDVYVESQNTTEIGNITAGTEKVTILETTGATPYIIIIDAQNNELYTATAGGSLTKQTPGTSSIAHGGAVLDGYLCILDEDGTIYNAGLDNPTSWTSTDTIKAERDTDKGVYLGRHHDHLFVLGSRTIEFFYNAANNYGSPLNRRADIFHNIGCISGTAVWEIGDTTLFLGTDPAGNVSVYKLENFQITRVSNDSIDSYLTSNIIYNEYKVLAAGVSTHGHRTLILTLYSLVGGEISPLQSVVYDDHSKIWGRWETTVNSNTYFPLVGWTKRTGGANQNIIARTAEGMFHNGDLIRINDNLEPVDTITSAGYVYGYKQVNNIFTDVAIDGTAETITSDAGGTPLMGFYSGDNIDLAGSTTTNDGNYNTTADSTNVLISTDGNLVDEDPFGDGTPVATITRELYVNDGYIVVTPEDETGTNISMSMRTGLYNGDTQKYKFMSRIRPQMEYTDGSETLTISWSDDDNDAFTTGRELDTSIRSFARRCGRFITRNFNVAYAGDEQVYIEGLIAEVEVGDA